MKEDLVADHAALTDDIALRRYFATFARITGHLGAVAGAMGAEQALGEAELEAVGGYLAAVAASFRALSLKYLVAGRIEGVGQGHLTIDRHDSGFPVYQELAVMANDAAQAAQHLQGMPDAGRLKDQMVAEIVGEKRVPVRLQYALSQRLYYEALAAGGLFFPQMHPEGRWTADVGPARRRFLIRWAVYDSRQNLPVIYLMDCEDSGRRPLLKDGGRWPEVQAHLMAQAVGGLKLLTIATGFDRDFADLHPKRLRRIFVGPMHAAAFTLQTGPIRDVLEAAKGEAEDDWALAWTVEDLESERVEMETGWFSETEREVFRLDPVTGAETGATRIGRNLILPQRPYQVLAEMDPPGFRAVRKFVVGREGRVMVEK